jgi:hypothetical protein
VPFPNSACKFLRSTGRAKMCVAVAQIREQFGYEWQPNDHERSTHKQAARGVATLTRERLPSARTVMTTVKHAAARSVFVEHC